MPNTVVLLEEGTSLPKDIEINLRLQGNVVIWPSDLDRAEAAALCNSLGWEPDRAVKITHSCTDGEPDSEQLNPYQSEELSEAMDMAASLIEASDYPQTWEDEHVELFTAIRRARDELSVFFERLAGEESGYVSTCRNLVRSLDQAAVPSHVTVVLLAQLLHPYPLLPER